MNGLNLLYAVGKGSENKPELVILKYQGNSESKETVALLGKGITFDTGGYNLKQTGSIESMFLDKSGACSVIATMYALAELNLKINVVACIPIAENVVSHNAIKPSDIVTSLKGLTVEITNTDAEGRLILADAMTYVQRNY